MESPARPPFLAAAASSASPKSSYRHRFGKVPQFRLLSARQTATVPTIVASEFQSAVNYAEIIQQCSGLLLEPDSSPVALAKPPSQLPSPLSPLKLKEASAWRAARRRQRGRDHGQCGTAWTCDRIGHKYGMPLEKRLELSNRGFMPKGTTLLALVHSPHRRFW